MSWAAHAFGSEVLALRCRAACCAGMSWCSSCEGVDVCGAALVQVQGHGLAHAVVCDAVALSTTCLHNGRWLAARNTCHDAHVLWVCVQVSLHVTHALQGTHERHAGHAPGSGPHSCAQYRLEPRA